MTQAAPRRARTTRGGARGAQPRADVRLDDAYTARHGRVLISGIQALVRLTLDQRRRDRARGLDSAAFVSGYEGSPLAGLDIELRRNGARLQEEGVVFRPGLNEELAATAVAGTQLLGQLEGRRHDGVAGFWFGKNPGLDRAADAIRHGNVSGTAPHGGAVAWIGDDPAAKSSTIPSACEPTCRSLMMPLLAPGSVAEVLALGRHAVEISRHAGLWCGMKIVAEVADAAAVVALDELEGAIPELRPRPAGPAPTMLPPTNLAAELDLMTERLARASEYARLAHLNRIAFEPRRPRVAIVAAGVAHQAVLRACESLGLGSAERERLGLRLVRLALPWPLGRDELRELLAGVETVVVVEDKLAFVETQVKEALYHQPDAPAVLGKDDADGRPLLSPYGTLGSDDVARALGHVLGAERLPASARARLDAMRHASAAARLDPLARRTPYFCSGCPHNSSTRASADQLVGAGIGCHVMIAIDGAERRGQLLGMPQMGGEGAQWLGLEPFTDDPHFIQNIGDGTFHHSGSLAIRAAVAAGVRMTFRLLYNDAVAMTGGQQPVGRLDVPALTRWLALEGVARIVVTTKAPQTYRAGELDPIAQVRHRDELQAAQAELAALDGVTVLLHVDRCANEERRLRKRGKLAAPARRVWINERVCEGCGDCGEQSSCLSVMPVDTEFGRKTRIHQSSCNQDFSCLKGDCPSFVMVTPRDGTGQGDAGPGDPPVAPPEPRLRVGREVLVRMPGVGGTGVVTVSRILQMAAHLDGRFAAGLEQTGLSQKGGPVISDMRVSERPVEGELRAAAGSADVLLGFDLLGAAAPDTLAVSDRRRTVAVINTAAVATAQMVIDSSVRFPPARRALQRIADVTRSDETLALDAQLLAERLFADHMATNILLTGAAFQHGCLPLGAAAIEQAIRLNGTAVEMNLAAFRWGRAAAADPDAVAAALEPPAAPAPQAIDPRARELLGALDASDGVRSVLERRAAELIAFQDVACARSYVAAVAGVAAVERERAGARSDRVTSAYARALFKLTAYKDEYEVARLHTDPQMRAARERELGPGAKAQIMLHPPLLRALGLEHKLELGGWAFPALRGLYALRRLRGTPLDPFGHTRVRRLERELPGEYDALVRSALEHLRPETIDRVVEIAELPDMIRGYEHIKLDNVERFRERAAALLSALAPAAAAVRAPAAP